MLKLKNLGDCPKNRFILASRFPYRCGGKNKGQSVLELVIALSIIVASVAAGSIVFFGAQSSVIDAQLSDEAVYLAREAVEAARSIARSDFNSLSSSSSTQDEFLKEIAVEDINGFTKKITVKVSWQNDPLRTQKIELITLLTNWRNIAIGGCENDPLSGNWAAPRVLGTGDLGAGNEGTDVEVKLPYVFVSGIASDSNKSDIFVFDVSNPAAPNLVKSLNIGSGGINSLSVMDNYLYAASSNDTKEFIVFDISDPMNITEIASLNLSDSANGLAVYAFSTSTVALGRTSSSDRELYFLNVSNPVSPGILTSVEIGDNVNDFTSTNQYLYLVGKSASRDVWIYDITNPASPVYVSDFDFKDGTEDIAVGFHPPANLMIGNGNDSLFVIDVSDPVAMRGRDINADFAFNTGGDVEDIVCTGGVLVFLATQNSTKEFIIADITNPQGITEYASLNFPQMATGIDYAENKVFISVRSNNALRIITSSP